MARSVGAAVNLRAGGLRRLMFWPANNFWPAGFWPDAFWPGVGRHFRLYELRSGALIGAAWAEDRELNLHSILPEGRWEVGLTYRNQFGFESPVSEMVIVVDAEGNVTTDLQQILIVEARPLLDGMIEVRWSLGPRASWMRQPATFEIAPAGRPGDVIDTLEATGRNHTVAIGPYPHGRTLRLAVRGGDADGWGPWAEALPVVADAIGPAAPTLG